MPEKSLEEILVDLWDKAITEAYRTRPAYFKPFIDQTVQSIRDYYLAKVPKEIPIPSEPLSPFMAGELSGFNSAIAEMRRAIEEG